MRLSRRQMVEIRIARIAEEHRELDREDRRLVTELTALREEEAA